MANYLPEKDHSDREGIAYISNVTVRDRFRRKGIAKRLVAKAEAQARSWGCRSIALHCDLSNVAAIKLYRGEGFKYIKVLEGANWPHPRISPDVTFKAGSPHWPGYISYNFVTGAATYSYWGPKAGYNIYHIVKHL